jgi:hypothetical protein
MMFHDLTYGISLFWVFDWSNYNDFVKGYIIRINLVQNENLKYLIVMRH